MTELRERLLGRAIINWETGCWEWAGAVDGRGYGRIRGRGPAKMAVHRAAWELLVGPIPQGLELDHLCRILRCLNPAHLEPVTHLENVRRAGLSGLAAEYAGRTRCPAGHGYDLFNTYFDPAGRRHCRKCKRARDRRRSR